jgi:hypothetical protein
VSRKAIERWRSTPDVGFPEPDAIVSGTPVWRWSTIQRWSQRTGYPKLKFNAKPERPKPIVGMGASPDGKGYCRVAHGKALSPLCRRVAPRPGDRGHPDESFVG